MRKIYSTLLLLAAATLGMQAQTDVTDEYFVNCDMEAGQSPDGWTTDLVIQYPGKGGYQEYPGFDVNFMETWTDSKNAVGSHNAQQTAQVPNGTYRLAAMVIATRQNRNDRTTEGVSIFANENSTVCNTYSGVPELFEVYTKVTDGSLTIGINLQCEASNPLAANWVAWDNVKVYYYADITPAQAELMALIETVSEVEFTHIANSVAAELKAALDADPDDADNAEAAIARLQAAYAAAQESEAAYASLLAAVEDAESFYDASYANADQLDAAIASAQAMYDAQAATPAEIEAEIESLTAVLKTYKELNAGDDGIDFTELITNPQLYTTDKGWEHTTGLGFEHNVAEYYDRDFDIHQTIEGLPNGRYKISVQGYYRETWNDSGAAYAKNEEAITAKLYANNKEVPLLSMYAHTASDMGLTDGAILNDYPNMRSSAEDAFIRGYYTENEIELIVMDGSLTIGLKNSDHKEGSWCAFRDFKVIYYGFDPMALLISLQDEIEAYMGEKWISDNYLDNDMLFGNVILLEDAVSESQNVSDDKEEVRIAYNQLEAIFNDVKAGEADFATFKALVMEAKDLADAAELPGVDALNAAIAQAEALLASEEAGNDDVAACIAVMQKAINAYKLSGEATFNEPIDATSLIVNPSFCNIDFDHTSGGSSRGWTWSQVANAGGDLRLNNKSGLNCWNSWNWDFTSMDLHQDIANLPAGVYAVTAKTMTELGRLNDQHAYITTPLMTGATYMTRDDNWEGEWEQLAISQKVLLTEGDTLRIGFASTHNPASSEGSNGWFCVTEFQLYYYGADATLLADDYNSAIDALLDEMQLAGDKAKVQDLKAQAAATEETVAKFAALAAAIELANTSQNTYSKFVEGAMADFMDETQNILSDQAGNIASNAVDQLDALMESDGITYQDLGDIEASLKAYITYMGTLDNAADALEEANNAYTEKLAAMIAEQAATLAEALADAATVNEYIRLVNAAMTDIQVSLVVEGEGNEDLTYLLKNADVRATLNDWTVESGTAGWQYQVAEFYQTNFNFHQTITVPNGNYTVSMYGFHRPGWSSVDILDKPATVVLYANEAEQTICSFGDYWYEECSVAGNDLEQAIYNSDSTEVEYRYYPFVRQAADAHFNDGHYQNQVTVDVTDHTLTIGLKKEDTSTEGHWVTFRDFNIYLNTLGDNEGWVIDTRIDNAQAVPAVQVVDGHIVVNSDNYQVYGIDGKQIAKNAALNKGVYIVRSGAHSLKVLVK